MMARFRPSIHDARLSRVSDIAEEREREERLNEDLDVTERAIDKAEVGRKLTGDIEVRVRLRLRRIALKECNLLEKIRIVRFILCKPGMRHPSRWTLMLLAKGSGAIAPLLDNGRE